MMRVTPSRLTTLQCSQIGFTLLRTFTVALQSWREVFGQDGELSGFTPLTQVRQTEHRGIPEVGRDRLERLAWVRSARHGTAEHDVSRSCPRGLGRRRHSRLVVRARAARADTGHERRQPLSKSLAD